MRAETGLVQDVPHPMMERENTKQSVRAKTGVVHDVPSPMMKEEKYKTVS